MNKQEFLKPFVDPSIGDFLNEKYWAIHEAVFILTEWPKKSLKMSFGAFVTFEGENIPEHEVDRAYIYQSEEHLFDPKKCGKKFKFIYDELVQAIVHGELDFKTRKYDRLVFFVAPPDVIVWALQNGYIFSKHLREALGFHRDMIGQQNPSKTTLTLCKKVREKIIAQFILAKDSNPNRTQLCNEVLKYFNVGRNNPESNIDLTAIRQNLNTLYLIGGKRGRIKHASSNLVGDYSPNPIPEVLQRDTSGIFCYNFPLFKIAMLQAAYFIILSRNSDDFSKLRVEEFFEEFKNDAIVSLYIQNNEYVLRIMKSCVHEAWKESMYWMAVKDIADQPDRLQKIGKI